MPFEFRTNKGAQMLAQTLSPGGDIKSVDVNLLWDIGELGSRSRPELNYEFNKTVRVKVK